VTLTLYAKNRTRLLLRLGKKGVRKKRKKTEVRGGERAEKAKRRRSPSSILYVEGQLATKKKKKKKFTFRNSGGCRVGR